MTWNKLGKIKLLIVDDDEFNRQLVISLLLQIPTIEFVEAEDGLEALSILKQTEIDMILLDLHMPNLNGYDTLLAIKKEPKYHHIPVAILTTDEQEKRKLYALGADDFLSKPYNLYELESRIYFHIENQQKEKLERLVKTKKTTTLPNNTASKNIQTFSIATIEQSQKEFFYEISKLAIESETDKNSIKVIAKLTGTLAQLVGYGKKIASDISVASLIRNMGALSFNKKTPHLEYTFSSQNQKAYEAYIAASYRLVDLNIETEFVKIAKTVILQQREHFDGSGFPKKRTGDQIHKVAYIVSLVETFNALLTDKNYHNHKIHSNKETYLILKSLSGQRLHPQITELFLEHFDYFVKIREKMINENIDKETIKYA